VSLLDECLSLVCASISQLNPNTRACFLLADSDCQTFERSITPNIPPSFGAGLKDAPINDLCIGTCGEAVYSGQPISCADIANDDRWSSGWRELCLAHGIQACYSQPVIDRNELPLGSLMLCFYEARQPTDWEDRLANFGTQIACIAFERDRTVRALHQSEERYRILTELSPQIVFMSRADGLITYCNQWGLEFAGRSLSELQGNGWTECIRPDHRDRIYNVWQTATREISDYDIEVPFRRADGVYRWLYTRALPVTDETGAIAYWLGVALDISDRKQAELEQEQLLEAEQQARSVAESAEAKLNELLASIREDFVLFDSQWRVFYLNAQAATTMRMSREEILGKNFWDLFPDLVGTEFYNRLHQVRRDQTLTQFEYYYPAWDCWFENLVYPTPDGIVSLSTNITERKQIEAEREQLLSREQVAREAAEQANRIKDEFLAVLSHELRSPLNPILGWSKLLQQGKLDATKTQIGLATIERNVQLQAQLIDDLLDISRILRGKLSLNQTPVNLRMVISSALETVRLAASAKSLQIQTVLPSDVGTVMGDAGRLQQIVWNLLSNAVKFTNQGGQITVALTQIGTHAQIQVMDTGKGINPDFLPYVFEHFRQEDGATTRKFGGLGLGLAIARQIVEMHGGQIGVDSSGEGQGTTFTVKLPLAPTLNQLPSTKSSDASIKDLNGICILVVDDEPDSRDFITLALELSGASVISVASGIEALTVIKQSIPDLIISDIGMPEMDGYMLLQQVRTLEQVRQVSAIALTAYAGEFDRQQALQAGFQKHLSKPIKPNQLIQEISDLIGGSSF